MGWLCAFLCVVIVLLWLHILHLRGRAVTCDTKSLEYRRRLVQLVEMVNDHYAAEGRPDAKVHSHLLQLAEVESSRLRIDIPDLSVDRKL